MICRECNARFEAGEMHTISQYYPYGEGVSEEVCALVCPECGSDLVEEACCCAECGGEFAGTDLSDGLCRVCEEELLHTLDWAWAMLSPAQKEWAAAHTSWMED